MGLILFFGGLGLVHRNYVRLITNQDVHKDMGPTTHTHPYIQIYIYIYIYVCMYVLYSKEQQRDSNSK